LRALVTGGAGFLGSTLVDRLLAEGHAVDVVDDLSTGRLANLADARADRAAELHIHQLDVRTVAAAELVERRQPEVVFHLAGGRHPDPVADVQATVVGALQILEGARRAGARKVVVAVGPEIYGQPDELPVRESQVHEPATAHAVAEEALVDYLRFYRDHHGIEFTALVLASVYGPRQRPGSGVVATFGRAVLAGTPIELHGDGRQTHDFLYVDDAVDALVRAAERGSGVTVNVGRGVETSVRHLLAVLADASGTTPATVPGPRASTVARLALDPTRARIQLGWEPWTSLEEGVAATLEALAKEVLTGRPDDLGGH
jgi:UDP-glucose 4-epimerase